MMLLMIKGDEGKGMGIFYPRLVQELKNLYSLTNRKKSGFDKSCPSISYNIKNVFSSTDRLDSVTYRHVEVYLMFLLQLTAESCSYFN